MGVTTQTVAKCDRCKKFIQEDEVWLDYSYAGTAFHWDCILSMSAAEFIELAHERGDQMFVRTGLDETEPYWAELKHLSWTTDARNIRNVLAAYRINRPRGL